MGSDEAARNSASIAEEETPACRPSFSLIDHASLMRPPGVDLAGACNSVSRGCATAK